MFINVLQNVDKLLFIDFLFGFDFSIKWIDVYDTCRNKLVGHILQNHKKKIHCHYEINIKFEN